MALLFDSFWAAYPKKCAKKNAEKAWKKISPDIELFNVIMSAVEDQKSSKQWQRENGRFIPYPATWLNQCRWNDELEPVQRYGNFDAQKAFENAIKRSMEND